MSVKFTLADVTNQLNDVHFIVQLVCSFLVPLKAKLALTIALKFLAETIAELIEDTDEAEFSIVVDELSFFRHYLIHLLYGLRLIL